MKLTTTAFILLTSAGLAGCSTAEYKAEYNSCSIEAYKIFPIKNEQVLDTCYRDVEIKTGETECITTPYLRRAEDIKKGEMITNTQLMNSTRTVCKELTETVQESYSCETTVDTNYSARRLQIKSCTQQACLTKYGNSDCE